MELTILNNVDKIKQMITDGSTTASNVKGFIKTAEKTFNELKEFVDDNLKKEIENGTTDKWEIRETGRMQYKEDQEWQKINELLKQREEKLKLAYQLSLKGDNYVDNDGVVIEPVSCQYTQAIYAKKL